MRQKLVQFEWDEKKAAFNLRKHGVTFEAASTVFQDPRLVTIADFEHSQLEDRWFLIGWTNHGALLSIVYLWQEPDPETVRVRLISARPATPSETRRYAIHKLDE